MFSEATRLVKNEKYPGNLIEDEAVLLDPDEGEVIRLNPVAAQVWKAVDGRRTVGEIVDDVARLFEGNPDQIKKEIFRFLKKLAAQEIVVGP